MTLTVTGVRKPTLINLNSSDEYHEFSAREILEINVWDEDRVGVRSKKGTAQYVCYFAYSVN